MPTASNVMQKLNWNATGAERIVQNASNLLSMGFYENAFERTMGIDCIDSADPTEISEEVYRNFNTFMPEVEILDIRVLSSQQGDARVEVDISIE